MNYDIGYFKMKVLNTLGNIVLILLRAPECIQLTQAVRVWSFTHQSVDITPVADESNMQPVKQLSAREHCKNKTLNTQRRIYVTLYL